MTYKQNITREEIKGTKEIINFKKKLPTKE